MPARLHRTLGLSLSPWLVVALCLLALPAAAQEGAYPTLAVRDHEVNKALAAQGEALYAEMIEKLVGFEEQVEGGSIARVNLDAIGKVFVGSQQLERVAEQLVLLGESAGVDFAFRASALEDRVRAVMAAYLATPAGKAKQEQGQMALSRRSQSHVRQVAGLARLAEQDRWPQAERELYEILDHINELGVWYDRFRRSEATEPYGQAQAAIEKEMLDLRTAEFSEQIEGDLELANPDFESYVASLKAAAEGFSSEGLAPYHEQQLTGPEFVAAWIEQWKALHWRVQQTRALQIAHFRTGGNTSQAVGELQRNYRAAMDEAYKAVKVVVNSDTNRVEAREVPELHAAYVAAFAPLEGLTGDEVLQDMAPALDRLAARSPEYQQTLTAYRLATEDYLRWSERIAEEETALEVQQRYPNYHTVLSPAVQQQEIEGVELPGLISRTDDSIGHAHLLTSYPPVDARLKEELPGIDLSFGTGIGLGDGRRSFVHYQNRCMAGVALPAGWADAVTRLEAGLLADDRHPPLTLATAGALASARRGDMTAMGATITNVELRGVTPFFATLPEAVSSITPLVQTQGGSPNRESSSEIVLRFSLDPKWVRHRYLFVPAE